MSLENQPISARKMQQLNAFTEGLTPAQLAWASGYLAGLGQLGQPGAGMAAASTATASGPALSILFGSQTGNGEKLAELLQQRATERGYATVLKNLADYKKSELKKEEHLLLIMSTHGEGDPPDTALELHEFIFSKRAPDLSKLKYSVLALGDTSYEHFCKTGRDFDEQFKKLGATEVYNRQDCDVDYEAAADEWMQGALDALAPHLQTNNGAASVTTATIPLAPSPTVQWSKSNPFMATMLERVNLNGRGSAKETLHIELSLEDSGLTYAPGDALGILPNNRPDLVFAVIELLDLDPETPVSIGKDESCTLREALTRHYELTVLTRPVVQRYTEWVQAQELLSLLETGKNKQFMAWAEGRDVIDLIKEFPPTGLTAQALVELLRKLPPRLYSIASSLAAHPDEVHLTVATVRYQAHGRDRFGVCSNYLGDLDDDALIPVYMHENRNFKLPTDDAAPVIMIGPGTGIAPFRAFLEEREVRGATGKNWLFFGDQHFTTDFLYQTELLKYHKDGILNRLDVAFSRDQAHKVYVQHRMQEQAATLYEWLQEGAYLYVCGDANRMAPDVHETLIRVLSEQGGQSSEEAEAVVKQMIKDKRYQRDTY